MINYFSLLDNSYAGQCLLNLILTTIGILGVIVLAEIFYLINTCKLEDFQGDGKIIKKRYCKNHFTFLYNLSTKKPLPHFSGNQYQVLVEHDGKRDWYVAKKECYQKIKVGQHFHTTYRIGRLNRRMYVTALKP